MSGEDRVEKKVDARQRGDVGRGGTRRLKAVTSGGAANSAIDAGGEASVRAWDEEGGRGLLLLGDGVKVGGREGAEMHRAESASGLDQLHQFSVAGEKPLGTEGTRQSKLEGERGARGIEVEDGGARGGDRGKRLGGRQGPSWVRRDRGGGRGGCRGEGHPLKRQRGGEGEAAARYREGRATPKIEGEEDERNARCN